MKESVKKSLLEKHGYKDPEFVHSGVYGSIYKVFKNDKKLAVKIMLESDDDYKKYGFVESNLIEISLLKSINHPNILSVYESDIYEDNKEDSALVIEMDYASANLDNWSEQLQDISRDEFDEIMEWVFQFLDALSFLHKHNIIHGDIKFDNVMLTRDREDPENKFVAKLGDFGLSRYDYPNVVKDHVAYCKPYKPPEVYQEDMNYNKSADIWALGLNFIDFFARRNIFGDYEKRSLYRRIMELLGKPPEEYREMNKMYNKGNIREEEDGIAGLVEGYRQRGWFKFMTDEEFDDIKKIIIGCLKYKGEERLTIEDILGFSIFKEYNRVEGTYKGNEIKEIVMTEDLKWIKKIIENRSLPPSCFNLTAFYLSKIQDINLDKEFINQEGSIVKEPVKSLFCFEMAKKILCIDVTPEGSRIKIKNRCDNMNRILEKTNSKFNFTPQKYLTFINMLLKRLDFQLVVV